MGINVLKKKKKKKKKTIMQGKSSVLRSQIAIHGSAKAKKKKKKKKKICVFQVSALKKLGMVGRHNILFLSKYFV